MARENPTWGYTRLRGALRDLGSDLGRSTIPRILKEHGIEPARFEGEPCRGRPSSGHTGTPLQPLPSSRTPAAGHFWMSRTTLGSAMRCLTDFSIHGSAR